MKKIFLLAGIVMISANAMAADLSADAVLLQALDKTTGRTSFLMVKVNESYTYGELVVNVKKCLKSPPEEAPENKVFINIAEKEGTEIFNGWMFSSNPALSAMEHPVYDIWVVECKEQNVAQPQVLPSVVPESISEEEISTEDLED